jgi:hypothetical protein
MNKIISYSLWGNSDKYKIGAIRNIELDKFFFPDWKVRIYLSTNSIFNHKSDNLEIIYRTETQPQEGCFWIFEACDSDDVIIIRDLDDRLSERHRFVVDEWLSSEKDIHIIRDHPNHLYPVMAGLWGCRNGILRGIKNNIDNWSDKDYYTTDQEFTVTKYKYNPEAKISGLYGRPHERILEDITQYPYEKFYFENRHNLKKFEKIIL